jgi:hypothetical protein
MYRKLIGACVGLAMMGMAGTARKKFVAGFAGLLATSLVSLAPMPANAITIIPSTVHGFVRDSASQDGVGDALNPINVEVLNQPVGIQDRGVIEFSIATLTSPVGSATLNLTRTFTTNLPAPIIFDVYGFTGDGVLTVGDYVLTTFNLGSFNYFDELTVDFDVTSFINSQIDLNDALQFSGILLVWGSAPVGNEFIIFGQSNVAGSFPTLTVSEAPEPSTLALFATGLALLAFLGWRRRRSAWVRAA